MSSSLAGKHRTGYHSCSITSSRAPTSSRVHRSCNSCACCIKRSLHQEWLCEGQQQLSSLLYLSKCKRAILSQSVHLSYWHCL